MYRQVLVHNNDQSLQKIFLRDSPADLFKVGRLKTVTYGTASASFLATKFLSVLADEVKSTQPQVAESIKIDFYTDDLITGAPTVREAISLQKFY